MSTDKVRLYLSHPTVYRKPVREWELKIESESSMNLDLVNPFYDDPMGNRGYIRDYINSLDSGNSPIYYKELNCNFIVNSDLSLIDYCDGVLVVLDGGFSIGTFMEMFYAKDNYIPVITVCLSNDISGHLWMRYCSDLVLPSLEEFAKWWSEDHDLDLSCGLRIGLTGKKRSGKDTVGNLLVDNWGFRRFAFGDELKHIVGRLFGVNRGGIESKPLKIRRLLQQFAGEGVRTKFPLAWVDVVMRRIDRLAKVLPGHTINLVVTDVRFKNEADALRANGFSIVRVIRIGDGLEDWDPHVSETEQEEIDEDYVIENKGTKEQLHETLEGFLYGIR